MLLRRLATVVVPLSTVFLCATATLGGCSGASPTASPEPVASLASPSPTQVFAGAAAEATDAAGKAVFSSAKIAVITAADDLSSQLRGASLARALGAPVLVDGMDDLAGQLSSWGVEDVLTVGSVPSLPDSITSVPAPASAADFTALTGVEVDGQALPGVSTQEEAMRALTELPDHTIFEAAPASAAPSTADSAAEPLGKFTRPQAPASPAATAPVIVVDPASGTVTALANLLVSGSQVLWKDPHTDPLSPELPLSAEDRKTATSADSILAVGDGFGSTADLEWRTQLASSDVSLPGGGLDLFRGKRYVALYGTPISGALGVLGEQDLPATIQRAARQAHEYQALTDDHVVPALEVIVTVAAGTPGDDGNYSHEWPAQDFVPLIEAAAAADQYVIIDFQPGRADFLTQVKQYQDLLRYPNVGIALDPEWRLGPNEEPLSRIGSVEASEVNQVINYLTEFVTSNALPPKMVVLHQFQLQMLRDRDQIETSHPQTPVLIHADGQGTQSEKQGTWAALHADAPAHVRWGWKNFIDEDHPMLSPQQTYAQVDPLPELVTYQ